MKRFVALFTTFCLLLCSLPALAEGVLVSEPVSAQVFSELTADSTVVQDMFPYMEKQLNFDSLKTNNSNQSYRKFTGGKNAQSLVEDYVDTITSGNYNFKLIKKYYSAYGTDSYYSYALEYTGSAQLPRKTLKMTYVDNVYCHLEIYGTTSGSSSKGYITLERGLTFEDLGLRLGGHTESISMPGTSFSADLYRLADGRYQTSDNRFHLAPNEAIIFRDGKEYSTSATLIRNENKNREELWISNFYRNESILLTVPYNSVLTGDVLDRRALGIDKARGYEQFFDSMDDLLKWQFSNKILGVNHAGKYILLDTEDADSITNAVVRILYWDAKQDAAVFYICIEFSEAPYEYEAVAAVTLGLTPAGTKSDGVYTVKKGDELNISFAGRAYHPSFELYRWEILEGSSLIELTHTREATCTVNAFDAGTVRLRVTYEYGAEEPDVLTGVPRNVQKSKTEEYVINITKIE